MTNRAILDDALLLIAIAAVVIAMLLAAVLLLALHMFERWFDSRARARHRRYWR